MSLATRCIACGTVFRVVQDQLKVSEGWVRCGRCGEVFNALEGLFDLEGTSGPTPLASDAEPPPRSTHEAPVWEEPVAPPPAPPAAAAAAAAAAAGADGPDTEADTQIDARADTQADSQADSRTDSPVDSRVDSPVDGRVDSRFNSRHDDDDALPAERPSRPPSRFEIEAVDSIVPDDALATASSLAPDDALPAFVRRASGAEQWQRPRVRRALWIAGALLALMLTTQAALRERDQLAARWPASQPWLASLCEWFSCTLQAPHGIESLRVESSGLTRAEGTGPTPYRLQVVVRNRADWPVALPALDVTLTDSRGEVVSRRVLQGRDLVPAGPSHLIAGAEWAIDAWLDLGDARVSGYAVELFYP